MGFEKKPERRFTPVEEQGRQKKTAGSKPIKNEGPGRPALQKPIYRPGCIKHR
jgi:hypothetical protein